MPISKEILTTWINNKLALIEAYQAAIIKLTTTNIQSYKLDTGQTEQWVTRLNLKDLQDQVSRWESEVEDLCSRRDGGNSVYVRMQT